MKNYLLICLFALIAGSNFAQVSVGLAVGGNATFSTWYNKDLHFDIDYKPALGWRTAVLGEWQISKIFALRAEIAGQMRERKLEVIGYNDQPGQLKEKLLYYEGSALFQATPFYKVVPIFFVVGCTGGRLSEGWTDISGTPRPDEGGSVIRPIDLDAQTYQRRSFMSDLGIGANLPLGKANKLKVEARYQYSLKKFSTSRNVDASLNSAVFIVGFLHRL